MIKNDMPVQITLTLGRDEVPYLMAFLGAMEASDVYTGDIESDATIEDLGNLGILAFILLRASQLYVERGFRSSHHVIITKIAAIGDAHDRQLDQETEQ